MKHFYLDVFFPFTFPARDLVTAAVDPFYSCGKNPKNPADRRVALNRAQDDIISQEKPNDFNNIKSSSRRALAHVLTTVIGYYKELNYSMFAEEFSEINASNSYKRHLLNHNFSLKNNLTS